MSRSHGQVSTPRLSTGDRVGVQVLDEFEECPLCGLADAEALAEFRRRVSAGEGFRVNRYCVDRMIAHVDGLLAAKASS